MKQLCVVLSFSPFLPGKQVSAFFSCFLTTAAEKAAVEGLGEPTYTGRPVGPWGARSRVLDADDGTPGPASNAQPSVGPTPAAVFNVALAE